ncbi:polysaccharide deacetylase family protein [Paenibacillus sp. Soil522]|uniref:polysaccharide deacetylase family protein n=1 Tax=Paenibacillus sp. Soil522 TaxID=1736388 RepID=UPI0006F50BF7|nr:polysaccharide deacetylase family protein [Paenibacillus sp. Soil522]KRE54345.1 xylanase deacetylase [Paenibacillus sp. Soil522]
MKRIIPLFAVLLLGAQLSACSAERQIENQPVSTEAAEAAVTQEPAATPASGSEEDAASPSEQPSPAASPGSGDDAKAAPLYRMNQAYRFVPIEESTPSKVVLLTFDDGPKDETILTSMLDTLDKHGAKAIFFVNGYRVKQNPELLKLINERGQTIGNHSWDHINLKNEPKDVIEKQIADVQTDIEALIGKKPIFFRPPFGSGGDVVKEIVKNHGMLYMTWSDGSLDWDKSTRDKPEEVIRNVLEQLHPGANILMHELPWTAEALEKLLTSLEQKGYGYIDPAAIDINR